MPKIAVLIEYFPTENSVNIGHSGFSSNGIGDLGNNINNYYQLNYESNDNYKGATPFILGASKLGYGDTLWLVSGTTRYKGFFSENLTSSDGAANLNFSVWGGSGVAISRFVIKFDAKAKQWATVINVNGVDYSNDGAVFVWKGSAATNCTVTIKKWNKPLYPVRITRISSYLTVEYDASSIMTLSVGNQFLSDNKLPVYGVIGQYGSMELVDTDGQILTFAELLLLNANLKIRTYLNKPNREDYAVSETDKYNAALKVAQIGDFVSEKWNYAYGNKLVKVEFIDTLLSWQKTKFSGFDLEASKTAASAFDMLNALSKNIVLIDTTTKKFLSTITINTFYMEASTLWEAWNKLCGICQLVIYKQLNGDIRAMRYQ
jgi:hypothetical protein